MEYEKWDEVLAPYNNAVEELKVKFKNIRKEFLTKGEYSPIEFVTGRTKKIASIVSKAKRLNIQDIEAEMEDIAGIRIMCQFVEDIYNIVNLIKSRSDMSIVYEKDYIKNFKDSHESLLIYGNAGVGKTFLVNCIAKELIEQAYSVIYLSAVQLFDLLADLSFNSHKSTGNKHISMRELLSCDLLIIDDLGTEMANSFTASSLFNCLNERLIRQKSTIISSNLSVDELKQNYTERIFSRAVGNYTVMKIFGDDIRIKSKFNN